MKKRLSLLTLSVLIAFATPAAAAVTIGLYSDDGSTCSFSGNNAGVVTVHVVVTTEGEGFRAVRFAAPPPECFGAVFVAQDVQPGIAFIGSADTGISLSSGICETASTHVLDIQYMTNGSTTACCPFTLSPDPVVPDLEAVDCAFNTVPLTSRTSYMNADATCECHYDPHPPVAPSNPTPADLATNQVVSTSLQWDGSDPNGQDVVCDLYMGLPSDPVLTLVASDLPGTNHWTYQPPARLIAGASYQWRVVARNSLGDGISGPVWTFSTRVNVDPTVTNVYPPDQFQTEGPLSKISWSGTDDSELNYDVHFGTIPLSPVVTNTTAEEYVPGPLQAGTIYYWYIVAHDEDGGTATGPIWSFKVIAPNLPPTVPYAPLPADDASVGTTTALFQWTSNDPENEAVYYDIYLGPAEPLTKIVDHQLQLYRLVNGLSMSMTYYWRIVAWDPRGHMTVGPTWSFNTINSSNAPPTVPSNPIPADHATTGPNPLLRWASTDPEAAPMRFFVSAAASGSPFGFGVIITETDRPQAQTFLTGGSYQWRVIAFDGLNFVAGPIWSFQIPGGPLPITITSFEARQARKAVEVRWKLSSDEPMRSYTIYRREGDALPITVADGTPTTEGSYLDNGVEAGKTYRYELVVRTNDGDEFRSQPATVTMPGAELTLHQNHPNPFNPQTSIRYELPEAAHVRLLVVDVSGRLVRTLVDGQETAGSREVVWNGRDDAGNAVSSGVYFYVLDAGKERLTRKLVLLK